MPICHAYLVRYGLSDEKPNPIRETVSRKEPRNAGDHERDGEQLERVQMLSGGGKRRAVHVMHRVAPTIQKLDLKRALLINQFPFIFPSLYSVMHDVEDKVTKVKHEEEG